MSSVLRSVSQRNNNLIQILPSLKGIINTESGIGPFDISGSPVYQLDITNLYSTGSTYFVDLSGLDLSGNLLNYNGQFKTIGFSPSLINFTINVDTPASSAPGAEFTIFFKNAPLNRVATGSGGPFSGFPLLLIGMIEQYGESIPFPYALSPPVPWVASPTMSQSVTFKSDGTAFNMCSSGPAGWLGVVLMGVLLSGGGGL